MRSAQTFKALRPSVLILAISILLAVPLWAQKSSGHRTANVESQQKPDLEQIESQYPGLLEEFGRLAERIKNEIHLPPTRTQSRLLPLLPDNTVGLVSLPNYGDALHQALTIFQQELKDSVVLRNWWQKADLGGPKFEDSLDKIYQVSQFLGDEVIISGGTSGAKGNDFSFLMISEVKKPGLEPFLQQLAASLDEKKSSPLHFLKPQELAAGNQAKKGEIPILLRPDLLAISSDIATLGRLNTRIERHEAAFASSQFGQRLAQSYLNGGASAFVGIDMHKLVGDLPIGPPKNQEALKLSGFGDLKYYIWEHKDAPGQPTSLGELAFNGPRHGVASWLAAPAPLGGIDFISPKAGMVMAVVLKSPARILDDIQELSGSSSGPGPLAMLDMMGQQFNINVKDDVLGKLTGEIVIEVEQPEGPGAAPSGKLVLRVNDADGLERTLGKLLEGAQMPVTPHRDAGFTWNSIVIPSGQSMTEIAYAFVDGYLVIARGSDSLKEAVRLHRSGESLAKSRDFLAGLPPGHSAVASAMMYQNFAAIMGTLGQVPPQFAQLLPKVMSGGSTATFAYAEPASIRWASNSGTVDVGVVLVAAAVAIPNLLHARAKANESAATSNLRTLNVAQVTYITSYPDQGYARSLAALGSPADGDCSPSPSHACLIDTVLGCDSAAGCVKSGYRFRLAAICKGSLCDDYATSAVPLGTDRGDHSFCSTSDAVIRWKTGAAPNTTISARECRTWEPIH